MITNLIQVIITLVLTILFFFIADYYNRRLRQEMTDLMQQVLLNQAITIKEQREYIFELLKDLRKISPEDRLPDTEEEYDQGADY